MVQSWDELPEENLLSDETRECVRAAIERLPINQRSVITSTRHRRLGCARRLRERSRSARPTSGCCCIAHVVRCARQIERYLEGA